uniref:Leucine-rich repeat-containing protein 51 n=1 Tax=Toxoplasma gondii (strain ATCC 50861 / VEG) TaxID=432359 RepID=A0A0F7V7T4_TOXGV|nr:TPA: leucine rich repeat protein, putative [Toxoplasma gondii VEG]
MQSAASNGRRSPHYHDYIVPTAPIDLSFRNYKSLADILPEHIDIANKRNSPCRSPKQATRPSAPPSTSPQQPARPTFMIALAYNNGVWPSSALNDVPESSSSKKPESHFRVTFSDVELNRNGRTSTAAPPRSPASEAHSLSTSETSEPQPPFQTLASGGSAPNPSSVRSSVCLSRHNSTVSLCTQPKNGFEGTVIDLHTPEKIHVKLTVTAVRLCNNQLSSLEELIPSLCRIMPLPERNLQWLDLAFNNLKVIDPSMQYLQSLRTLYLHCNLIASYSCLLPLKGIRKLRTLTLMGNPVERDDYPDYRSGGFRHHLSIIFFRRMHI